MSTVHSSIACAGSVVCFLAAEVPVALAQSPEPASVHWAYGAYFGTGKYTIGGTESVYVLSGRPGWTLKDPELTETSRTVGIRVQLPIAIGVHSFDVADVGNTLQLDNIGTLTAAPGVEFDVPINARWSLKPLVYAGRGEEIDGPASARIYWTGVKSRGRFRAQSFDWAFVNSVTLVGYADNAGERGRLLAALTGFEFDKPLATKKINGHGVHIHWHVSYTDYFNEVDIRPTALRDPIRIGDEWEVGVAFSTGEHRLGIRKLRWDRVGLAYRFSSDGNLEGISLNFASLFDR